MTHGEHPKNDHVVQTIATYNVIAPDYILTATPEVRAWEENSMCRFSGFLSGTGVLVPGCGDGRDSRFLASLGLAITSFDLSDTMLKIAKAKDPDGSYFKLDLRDIDKCSGPYDGIFSSGCLYHLTKPEFTRCVQASWKLLAPAGVFYLNMKEGQPTPAASKLGNVCKGSASTPTTNTTSCCKYYRVSKSCISKN